MQHVAHSCTGACMHLCTCNPAERADLHQGPASQTSCRRGLQKYACHLHDIETPAYMACLHLPGRQSKGQMSWRCCGTASASSRCALLIPHSSSRLSSLLSLCCTLVKCCSNSSHVMATANHLCCTVIGYTVSGTVCTSKCMGIRHRVGCKL